MGAESIKDALIRIHRREVLRKVGPQAERYLPNQDLNAFLLPDSRLEPVERKWQKVFVALPWAVFACMLAVPLLLVRTNLPWLQKRAEEDKVALEARNAAFSPKVRVPVFEVVSFGQVPDILERPFPTVLLLFDPATLASKIFLPALQDLEAVLRTAGIAVAVAALDLNAAPRPPDDFLWEYPCAMAPHLQLIVPRACDGEAGVVDYDEHWTAAGIAEAARKLAGPRAPLVPPEELERLDGLISELRDELFELLFIEEEDLTVRQSWWGWAFSSSSQLQGQRDRVEAARKGALVETESSLELGAGLEAAAASCRGARHRAAVE